MIDGYVTALSDKFESDSTTNSCGAAGDGGGFGGK